MRSRWCTLVVAALRHTEQCSQAGPAARTQTKNSVSDAVFSNRVKATDQARNLQDHKGVVTALVQSRMSISCGAFGRMHISSDFQLNVPSQSGRSCASCKYLAVGHNKQIPCT
eukprot:2347454-Pleurochrysis_carterae.AAC.2